MILALIALNELWRSHVVRRKLENQEETSGTTCEQEQELTEMVAVLPCLYIYTSIAALKSENISDLSSYTVLCFRYPSSLLFIPLCVIDS